MRGFEGFLFSVALPALFVGMFGFAVGADIRKDWRNRHRWPEAPQESTFAAIKELLKLAFVSVWMVLMLFVVYTGLRIHYDMWALQASDVREVMVDEQHFTDRPAIAEIVNALNSSEWYSVNHGGWGDETSIVIRMESGTEWQLRAGYHFAQHGAVVIRSSRPGGRGWQLGEVFSPALDSVLERLGAPLSRCDTVHGHPCGHLQSHPGTGNTQLQTSAR